MPRISLSVLLPFLFAALAPSVPVVAQAPEDAPSSTAAPSPAEVAVAASPEAAAQPALEPAVEVDANAEPPSPGARARLAIWQTVHGAIVGGEICGLLECAGSSANPRGPVGAVLLGMGVGAGVSLLATRAHGISSGDATLYNTAPLVGTMVGYELFAMVGRREPTLGFDERSPVLHPKAMLGTLLAGQLGSYAIAFGLDRGLHPRSGEVIFAESASLWLTGLTTLAIWDARGLGDNTQVRRAHAGYLVTTLGGLVGGGWLARRYDISASRTLVVDSGGVVGGGLGLLVGFFVLGDNVLDHEHAVAWSVIGGSVGGLALSLALTPALDRRGDRLRDVALGITPQRGGATVQLAMRLP